MENQTPQETNEDSHKSGPNIPARTKLIFTLALVLIAVGMYVGTYYKIVIYGP